MTRTGEDSLKPTTELARTASAAWGFESGDPVLLKHRENAVFRIQHGNHVPAVLRIHRLNYHSDAALQSELKWMAHLHANGFPVPQPRLTRSGKYMIRVATPHLPEPRQVDCLSWIDGEPLGLTGVPLDHDRQTIETLFFELGCVIARMHELTTAWTLPAGFQRHAWDMDGFFGPAPVWGHFEDSPLLAADARKQVSAARNKAMEELAAYEQSGRTFGLIHSDLVRENLLVSGDKIRVIDFDDCGFGWHMYDIAVALYQNLQEPLFPVMRESILAGYRSLRNLTGEDLATLPLFLSLRAFALIGWMQTRADNETSRDLGSVISARAAQVAADYLQGTQQDASPAFVR